MPCGQRYGSLRPYSRFSRQEPATFLSSSSSVVLTRLSAPRFRPTTYVFLVVPIIWYSRIIVMWNRRARYGIMVSSSSFRISPETLSGPTDLFLPTASNLILTISLLMRRGHIS
jgi:hypothetical protein